MAGRTAMHPGFHGGWRQLIYRGAATEQGCVACPRSLRTWKNGRAVGRESRILFKEWLMCDARVSG